MAEKSSRRETIEPNPGDKRYVRRNDQGEFTEQDDTGRSLGQVSKYASTVRGDTPNRSAISFQCGKGCAVVAA